MRRAALALAAAATMAALGLAAEPAAGQQRICSERSNFIKHLGENHAEAPSAMGLASNGSMLEVLTSDSGSWTIIITNPSGVTCLVAAGEAWEDMPRVALKPNA